MKSDFLFAQPSFVGGVAGVIDLEGINFYNTSKSTSDADKRALRSDWKMVGNDIKEAIAQYGRQ